MCSQVKKKKIPFRFWKTWYKLTLLKEEAGFWNLSRILGVECFIALEVDLHQKLMSLPSHKGQAEWDQTVHRAWPMPKSGGHPHQVPLRRVREL